MSVLNASLRHMLLGCARVSTAEQNPDHQTDALARASVDPSCMYLDRVSGAKARAHIRRAAP